MGASTALLEERAQAAPAWQPRWRAAAASVQGAGHEKRGRPCQDAHQWDTSRSSVLIAAVADGAGSASMSEAGSAAAVRRAVAALLAAEAASGPAPEADAWCRRLTAAMEAARRAVADEAAARSVTPQDLATTLLLVVAAPGFVATAQVGDGAVVARGRDGTLVPLTTPPRGEYLNETTFITSPGAVEATQFHLWEGAAAGIAAFTDGLQMLALKMPEATPHVPFFEPLFQFLDAVPEEAEAAAQLETFLRSHRVRQRTDDDLTLLLATLAA